MNNEVPPAAPLVLAGVVHGDPHGYGRALHLLQVLQPSAVAVEISPFSVAYRRRHAARWQRLWAQALSHLPRAAAQHLALRRVAAQVAMPFEVRAAEEYCRATGALWQPVDSGVIARRHLPRYAREVLTAANLRALLQTPDGSPAAWVAGEFRRARRLLSPGARQTLPGRYEDARNRERLMARRLRALVFRVGRVVHLGGWEHLLSRSDGESLPGLLKDLAPAVLLLDEVDRWGPGDIAAEACGLSAHNEPLATHDPVLRVARRMSGGL